MEKNKTVLSLEPLRQWSKCLHKENFSISAEILGKKNRNSEKECIWKWFHYYQVTYLIITVIFTSCR